MNYKDRFIKQKWDELADVPINYSDPSCPDGKLEEDWFIFKAGTEKIQEIWYWFDLHYSKGIMGLMFGGDAYGEK